MTTATRYFTRILLVVASLALVQMPAWALDDVCGWEGTTWGMTESEVVNSMEARGFHLDSTRIPLRGPFAHDVVFRTSVEIEGNAYDVALQFLGRPRRLSGVLIGALDEARERALALHRSLLRTLIARYGSPSRTDSRSGVSSATRWEFKTTTIALHLDADVSVSGHRATQVSVVYSPTGGPDQGDARQRLLAIALLRLLGEGWRP